MWGLLQPSPRQLSSVLSIVPSQPEEQESRLSGAPCRPFPSKGAGLGEDSRGAVVCGAAVNLHVG